MLLEAIAAAGYTPGRDVAIGLDPAASELFEDGHYVLKGEGRTLEPAELVDLWEAWGDKYPIVSIEDGLAEDDWDGWTLLTGAARRARPAHRRRPLRHPDRAARSAGIDRRRANAILIKLNQVGTLTETLDTIALATPHGYRTVVSAPSGETEDTTIADLAVATAAGQIKIGSVARSERLAKYNRLLRIEHELGERAVYAGATALHRTPPADQGEPIQP